MRYEKIIEAEFIERLNRFVAVVKNESLGEFSVHVPNTGRCREILLPGTKVWLQQSENKGRKYPYSLYAAYKGDMLIHMDSAAANTLVEEALRSGTIDELTDIDDIAREKTFAKSRFDFRFLRGGRLCYMEVKGVTLEENGVAKFPDAPTERGSRHLRELAAAVDAGFGAYVIFAIQMAGVEYFTPNRERDPRFAEALAYAASKGVNIMAYDAAVTPGEIVLNKKIPVKLED